jgi:DNA end-binding protein Ku
MVERSEVEKGYEYEKDQYLLFNPAELKAAEPESARTMNILEFVKLKEIDPLYFDASYHLGPQEAGIHAYRLLARAMQKSGFAGIAKMTMHNREYTVIIRPYEKSLVLHTMFYENEIRAARDTGDRDREQIKDQEEALAIQLIENLAAPFHPEKYQDSYQQRLNELIQAKSEGRTITPPPRKGKAPVIDLMTALKKSLAQGTPPPAHARPVRAVVRSSERGRRRRKAS